MEVHIFGRISITFMTFFSLQEKKVKNFITLRHNFENFSLNESRLRRRKEQTILIRLPDHILCLSNLLFHLLISSKKNPITKLSLLKRTSLLEPSSFQFQSIKKISFTAFTHFILLNLTSIVQIVSFYFNLHQFYRVVLIDPIIFRLFLRFLRITRSPLYSCHATAIAATTNVMFVLNPIRQRLMNWWMIKRLQSIIRIVLVLRFLSVGRNLLPSLSNYS